MFLPPEKQIPQAWARVAEYLLTQGIKMSREEAPRQFSSGAANLNYLIVVDGQRVVLRRPPDGVLPVGGNDVTREFKVLSRLWNAYPYAPRGLLLCEDRSVIGVPFCLSEFRTGDVIGRELPERLAGQVAIGARLSELIVSALARLHRVDAAECGLTDLGRPGGFIRRQIEGWYKRGAAVLSSQQQVLSTTIRDWLLENEPAEQPYSIVHNDFKLDNMLLDTDTLEVRAVLDWDMCTIGNPYYELAIVMTYWGEPDDNPNYELMTRMPCDASQWWSRRRAIQHYLSAVSASISEEELKFYWVLALYRNSVVFAQLRSMFERGALVSDLAMSAAQLEYRSEALLLHNCNALGMPLDW